MITSSVVREKFSYFLSHCPFNIFLERIPCLCKQGEIPPLAPAARKRRSGAAWRLRKRQLKRLHIETDLSSILSVIVK
jgi:hypothetical protein